ncbi:MAG: hypothetical protein J7L69_06035, partial [Desulfobulbaceae bacterium]|nr:hypothetical protein [Desulfobulbaceae bacterium]
ALERKILKLITVAAHGTRKFDSFAMKKLFVPVPPIALQNQFAAIVEKVEGIKNRYQQSLTELENLYGTLSQKAFKGELDLSRVPLAKNEPDEQQENENDVKAEKMAGEETRSIELPERLISAVR